MDKSKSKVRREYERDLKSFHVTDEEIDAMLEHFFGYRVRSTFIFNTRRKTDDKEEKQR